MDQEWKDKLRAYAEAAKPFQESETVVIEGKEECVRFLMFCSPRRILDLLGVEPNWDELPELPA